MTTTFYPTPKTHDEFIEHVSKNIFGNQTTPNDFEATLAYVLFRLPVRSREIFLAVERDNISVRTLGVKYSISGQRVHEIKKKCVEDMKASFGDMLSLGIEEYQKKEFDRAKKIGENNSRSPYYKSGYADGYSDGIARRKQKYFVHTPLHSISLSDLNLSFRAEHYLSASGLLTASQIVNYGDNIAKIPNIGKTTLFELLTRLHDFNVDVYECFPETMKRYKFAMS